MFFYSRGRCFTITNFCFSQLGFIFFVQAGEGNQPFVCKIVEMFEGANGKLYFTARWFYRADDTVRLIDLFFFTFSFYYVELSEVFFYS